MESGLGRLGRKEREGEAEMFKQYKGNVYSVQTKSLKSDFEMFNRENNQTKIDATA